MSRGFNVAQDGHWVPALSAVDMTGGKSSDIWSMRKHSHASIKVEFGVSAAAPTSIIVNACSDLTGAGRTAIPFGYHVEDTAAGDTLGARIEVAATGITTIDADNGVYYAIEIDAAQLPDGLDFLEVVIANGTNSVIGSIDVVLSGSRYAQDLHATAIA